MESKSSSSSAGISFGGALFLVFLVLKLTHVIDWSWWWVTAPLWVPVCIAIVACVLWAIYYVRSVHRGRSEFSRRIDAMRQEREKVMGAQKGSDV